MGNYCQEARTFSIGIDTAYLYIAFGGKPRKSAITGKIKNKYGYLEEKCKVDNV